jgi:uncharacterized repeat protein (TIGR03803 family)
LYSFPGGNDGAYPEGMLVQGSDGYFYGTTGAGGTNGDGTVFKISPNGTLTTLYSFTGINDGGNPQAGLVPGSDGTFYGTTGLIRGPCNDCVKGGPITSFGTVFKISTNGALITLYSFTGGNDGANPSGGLVQGSDGNFYGTTASTVFQITPTGVLTTLDSGLAGPSSLVQGSDGNFYGTTASTVFQITPTGVLTTLDSGLAGPSSLVQGSDGSFYGTTSAGGAGGAGTVFRLTIMPEFQAVTLTNKTLILTFSTEAGGMYQLQYNSDLTSTDWTNLGSPIPATGATLTATDSLTTTPQRFYRLVLAP